MASISSEPLAFGAQDSRGPVFQSILRSRWTFFILQILDLLTTLYAFHVGAFEANPLVARLTVVFGDFGGVLMSKLIAIAIAMGVRKRLWIINAFYTVIVSWNFLMIAGMMLPGK